jgi:hypothetical protein
MKNLCAQECAYNWAPVAKPCNSSYSRGRDQKEWHSKPGQANSSRDPILKIPHTKKGWGSGSSSRKCETLSTNPNTTTKKNNTTTKKKKKRKRKRKKNVLICNLALSREWSLAECQWLVLITLATREAKIRRSWFEASPGKLFTRPPSPK